jgi:hypothetical protein
VLKTDIWDSGGCGMSRTRQSHSCSDRIVRDECPARQDLDCATRVSKAGHGSDRVWKAWKAKKPAFHPSHTLWKSLRDYHIPTASTAGIFQDARPRETESNAFGLQGVVMEVPGPKCNGCSGTLTPLRKGRQFFLTISTQDLGGGTVDYRGHMMDSVLWKLER